ncbi:MAG: methyltransferase domain-containing protein [Chloroflexota bacterium]
MVDVFVPPRWNRPELLDLGAGSPEDVRQSLRDLRRLNRLLGGTRALTQHLYPRILAQESSVSILDIGTGDGALSETIIKWADANGQSVQCIGLELMARNLAMADDTVRQHPCISLLQADAFALPLRENSVDYVVCSLILHHFSPEQIMALLKTAYHVARRGIIMSDLTRGWLPYIGYKLITPVFGLHPITRHDGAVSIRRGYTVSEMRAMSDHVGLTHAQVHWHPMFRMTLVADKEVTHDAN